MSEARPLTKNPTLMTAVLSLAAAAGYITYRLTVGVPEAPAPTPEMAGMDHDRGADDGAIVLADALPDVVLDNLDGQPTPLATWAGKPLLINFWATWCGPCRREIPMLMSFKDQAPSIQIVGIAVDDLDDVRKYADETKFNYPILAGVSGGIQAMTALHNDTQTIPFTVFAAPDGTVLGIHAGVVEPDDLTNFRTTIDSLVAGRIDLAAARERLAYLR
jgi:thiol-disulfide isomerase/thioredoxin